MYNRGTRKYRPVNDPTQWIQKGSHKYIKPAVRGKRTSFPKPKRAPVLKKTIVKPPRNQSTLF